jgi:hypothetical protein
MPAFCCKAFSFFKARTGQNFESGKVNMSTNSPPGTEIFGAFNFISAPFLKKIMSFQSKSENLSNTVSFFDNSSPTLKAPK